ncbi:hypothetical protein LY78DRAFT_125183 [Colletotrichum sublineola]|nr:hypothetical protein LY78DRAFT_125183 [Colletotrichum sublineola]
MGPCLVISSGQVRVKEAQGRLWHRPSRRGGAGMTDKERRWKKGEGGRMKDQDWLNRVDQVSWWLAARRGAWEIARKRKQSLGLLSSYAWFKRGWDDEASSWKHDGPASLIRSGVRVFRRRRRRRRRRRMIAEASHEWVPPCPSSGLAYI